MTPLLMFIRVLVLSLLFLSFGLNADEISKKPNIVIIIADDLGWGDLQSNGNPVTTTPHLDQLASGGVTADRFFVNAVCSPTRAELMTGRYAVRGGVWDTSAGGERLDLDEITFAEVLKDAGYRTGIFGKWHSGMQYPYHPNARGFDEFIGYCSGHWGSYMDAMLEHNSEVIHTKGYLTDVLTDSAIQFFKADPGIPSLAILSLNTPHSPMQVPHELWAKYSDVELPLHRYSGQENPDHTRAAYAMTENIDWNVGRFLNAISDSGLKENTIVIFMSDNGPNGYRWNADMKGKKGYTDEGGVRSPFMIRWPNKLNAGSSISSICHVIDLFPTLLDFADINCPAEVSLDGVSLVPLLTGHKSRQDRLVFSYWSGKLSVRSKRFRLSHENELFDMWNDPSQKINVVRKYPNSFRQLFSAKKRWMNEVLSELPAKDERLFTIAHPDADYDWLPARDGIVTGGIERSNRWPNCSFYTNWKSLNDSISWPVEVLSDGSYEAVIYYTCKDTDVGAKIRLSGCYKHIDVQVDSEFDSPLVGKEYDRFPREESYTKTFNPLKMGVIDLTKGSTTLSLHALEIPGESAIDFRLLTLRRVD